MKNNRSLDTSLIFPTKNPNDADFFLSALAF